MKNQENKKNNTTLPLAKAGGSTFRTKEKKRTIFQGSKCCGRGSMI